MMFGNERDQWLRRFQGIWQVAYGLLAPPSKAACLLCGGMTRGAAAGELCSACSQSIPWITSVYCVTCGRYEPCDDCRRRTEAYFVRNRSAVSYDSAMKELLAQYKYRGDERLLSLLVDMLSHAYQMHVQDLQELDELQAFDSSPFQCITYIPLSEERLLERGFNQAQQLAEGIGRRFGIPTIPLLQRVRHTDKQSFKTRQERLRDLAHAFEIDEAGVSHFEAVCASVSSETEPTAHRARKVPKLLIIDDVYTTGTTLNECSRVISGKCSVEIYGITWAR